MSDVTLYPQLVDTFTTKIDQTEPDNGDIIWADHVNKLQNAVVSLETVIGTLPDHAGYGIAVVEDETKFEFVPRTFVSPTLPVWAPPDSLFIDTDDWSKVEWVAIAANTTLLVSDGDLFECVGEDVYVLTLSNVGATKGCQLQVMNSTEWIIELLGVATTYGAFGVVYPGQTIMVGYNGTVWRFI